MIRPTTVEDISALKGIIAATQLFPPQLLDGMLEGYLSRDDCLDIWLTLVDDQGPIGLAYVGPEPMTAGTWNCYLIAIHPTKQLSGHGTTLMNHIETHLAQQHQRVLIVETSGLPEFEATRRFYVKSGYTEEARIREFYSKGEDKVVYWKSLEVL